MTMLKLGIVGFGAIARNQHVAAIAVCEGVELVAIADPALPDAVVPVYPDMAAMLAGQPEINAVAMCQPPRFRFAATKAALDAGLHVLLEKPPAITSDEGEVLSDLARSRGLTIFTAWHSQEGSAVKPARDWLADAAIESIRIEWKEDVRQWHPGQQWIWEEGGFGVFDPGINALSILTELVDGEVQLASCELEVPENCATPIAASLELTGPGGFPISAEFDWRQTGPQTWDICCRTNKGVLLLSQGGNRLSIDGQEQYVDQEGEYAGLYSRFVNLARCGGSDVDLAPLRLAEKALVEGVCVCTTTFEGHPSQPD